MVYLSLVTRGTVFCSNRITNPFTIKVPEPHEALQQTLNVALHATLLLNETLFVSGRRTRTRVM